MKTKVLRDRETSFSFFMKNLIKAKEWPWVLKGSLDEIDEELIDKASEYNCPAVSSLKYGSKPLEDLKESGRSFKKLIEEAKKVHESLWTGNQDKIKLLTSNLRELKEKYLDFILDEIMEETGTPWSYEILFYVPCIYKGGSVERNFIFIGIDFRKKYLASERVLQILTHETVHSNVFGIEKKLRKKGIKTESTEIAANLVVNRVIEKLNKEFGLNLKEQGFNKEFLDLEGYRKELSEIYEEKESYEETIRSINEFLETKGYETAYKGE